MEPAVGVEPTTRSLQNCCSATELSWLRTPKNAPFRPVGLTPSLRSGFRAFSRGPRSFDTPMLAPCGAPRFGLRVLYYLIFNNPKNASAFAKATAGQAVSPFEASAFALWATAGQARPDVPSRQQTCQAPVRHTADCAAIGVSRSRRSVVSPSGVSPAFSNITPQRAARNLARGRFSEKSA